MRITNTLSDVRLRATPVLFMADGTEYSLPAVTVAPAGVVDVGINDALEKAPLAIREHSSTFGSATIRYRWIWQAALSGTVLTVDTEHSLTFTTAFVSPAPPALANEQHTAEGIYWLPFEQSRAVLTLYNASQDILTAQLSTFDHAGRLISSSEHTIPPNSTARSPLHIAPSTLSRHLRVGGVRVSYTGTTRSLIVNGGIEDYQHGFSLSMAFIRPMIMNEMAPRSQAIASSGLMTGIQDPMMGFPIGTTFKPFATLRNISMEPITVTPVLEPVNGSNKTPEIRGKTLAILPNETIHMDLDDLREHLGNHISMLNAVFEVIGPQNALLLSSGSIDHTGNYVFEVEPEAVSTTETKQIPYWSTAEGYDTMITVWNPTDFEQHANLRFFTKEGEYALPFELKEHSTISISVKELQRTKRDEGSEYSFASMKYGSAWISAASGTNGELNLVASVGIYNARRGICGTICPSCLGYVDYWLIYNPFDLGYGYAFQAQAFTENEGGGIDQVTNRSSWVSDNNSIAPSLGSGNYQGNSIGAFTASASLVQLSSDHSDCVRGQPCPTETFGDFSPSSVANVNNWFTDGSLTNAVSSWQYQGNGNYQLTVSGPAYVIIQDFQSATPLSTPICTFPSPWCAVVDGAQVAITVGIAIGSLIGLRNIWVQKIRCPIGWPGSNPNQGPAGWTVGQQNGKPYYESPDKTKSVSPDLDNSTDGPHWDYNDKLTKEKKWRVWPSGDMTPKEGQGA